MLPCDVQMFFVHRNKGNQENEVSSKREYQWRDTKCEKKLNSLHLKNAITEIKNIYLRGSTVYLSSLKKETVNLKIGDLRLPTLRIMKKVRIKKNKETQRIVSVPTHT